MWVKLVDPGRSGHGLRAPRVAPPREVPAPGLRKHDVQRIARSTSRVSFMTDVEGSEYSAHRDRARAASARQLNAEARAAEARRDRDSEVMAMLATPGASLGSVAADVGLSKSMVAFIQRTTRAAFESAEHARDYLEQHPDA